MTNKEVENTPTVLPVSGDTETREATGLPVSGVDKWLRHDEACDAAAWEQRNRHHAPSYRRPTCTCGLDSTSRRMTDALNLLRSALKDLHASLGAEGR